MNQLLVCVSMHFSSTWQNVLKKFLKNYPDNLKKYKLCINVDVTHDYNDFDKINSKLNELNQILHESVNELDYYVNLVFGGLKNSMYNTAKLCAPKYILFCEFDFIFTKKFHAIDIDSLINDMTSHSMECVMFEREKYQKYSQFFGDLKTEKNFYRKTILYSNNNFITEKNKFLDLFEMVYKTNKNFSGHTRSHGLEAEFNNLLFNDKFKYEQYYYGASASGPYIHHIDASKHYLDFDIHFKKGAAEKLLNLKNLINDYDKDKIFINPQLDNSIIEYVKIACEYNNIELIESVYIGNEYLYIDS